MKTLRATTLSLSLLLAACATPQQQPTPTAVPVPSVPSPVINNEQEAVKNWLDGFDAGVTAAKIQIETGKDTVSAETLSEMPRFKLDGFYDGGTCMREAYRRRAEPAYRIPEENCYRRSRNARARYGIK